MWKKFLHLLSTTTLFFCVSPIYPAMQTTGRSPNIIFFLADDLGWKDVGYHGSEIQTPNIDRMAASVDRLEQFYAMPLCTPTRAGLMSGR